MFKILLSTLLVSFFVFLPYNYAGSSKSINKPDTVTTLLIDTNMTYDTLIVTTITSTIVKNDTTKPKPVSAAVKKETVKAKNLPVVVKKEAVKVKDSSAIVKKEENKPIDTTISKPKDVK